MAILLTNKVDLTGLKDGDSRLNTINGDICQTILNECQKEGKDIFLFGGGVLSRCLS